MRRSIGARRSSTAALDTVEDACTKGWQRLGCVIGLIDTVVEGAARGYVHEDVRRHAFGLRATGRELRGLRFEVAKSVPDEQIMVLDVLLSCLCAWVKAWDARTPPTLVHHTMLDWAQRAAAAFKRLGVVYRAPSDHGAAQIYAHRPMVDVCTSPLNRHHMLEVGRAQRAVWAETRVAPGAVTVTGPMIGVCCNGLWEAHHGTLQRDGEPPVPVGCKVFNTSLAAQDGFRNELRLHVALSQHPNLISFYGWVGNPECIRGMAALQLPTAAAPAKADSPASSCFQSCENDDEDSPRSSPATALPHHDLSAQYPAGPILLMEYVDGPLDDVLTDRALGAHAHKLVLGQLLRAVVMLHTAWPTPYVHGQINGLNVLVAEDGRTVLAAAEAAQPADADEAPPRILSDTHCNPCYQAPELLLASGRLQPSADVFSIGCVMYKLFTGRDPCLDPEHMPAAAEEHSRRIPSFWYAVMQRCLQDDAARRPSCQELLAVIEEAGGVPRPASSPRVEGEATEPLASTVDDSTAWLAAAPARVDPGMAPLDLSSSSEDEADGGARAEMSNIYAARIPTPAARGAAASSVTGGVEHHLQDARPGRPGGATATPATTATDQTLRSSTRLPAAPPAHAPRRALLESDGSSDSESSIPGRVGAALPPRGAVPYNDSSSSADSDDEWALERQVRQREIAALRAGHAAATQLPPAAAMPLVATPKEQVRVVDAAGVGTETLLSRVPLLEDQKHAPRRGGQLAAALTEDSGWAMERKRRLLEMEQLKEQIRSLEGGRSNQPFGFRQHVAEKIAQTTFRSIVGVDNAESLVLLRENATRYKGTAYGALSLGVWCERSGAPSDTALQHFVKATELAAQNDAEPFHYLAAHLVTQYRNATKNAELDCSVLLLGKDAVRLSLPGPGPAAEGRGGRQQRCQLPYVGMQVTLPKLTGYRVAWECVAEMHGGVKLVTGWGMTERRRVRGWFIPREEATAEEWVHEETEAAAARVWEDGEARVGAEYTGCGGWEQCDADGYQQDWCKKQTLDRALAVFAKAASIDPSHLPTMMAYADALVLAGRSDKGAKVLKRALKYNPASAVLNAKLGEVLHFYHPEEADLADESYRAAIKHGGQGKEEQANLLGAYATFLVQRGAKTGAIQAFREALAVDPNHANNAFNAGIYLKILSGPSLRTDRRSDVDIHKVPHVAIIAHRLLAHAATLGHPEAKTEARALYKQLHLFNPRYAFAATQPVAPEEYLPKLIDVGLHPAVPEDTAVLMKPPQPDSAGPFRTAPGADVGLRVLPVAHQLSSPRAPNIARSTKPASGLVFSKAFQSKLEKREKQWKSVHGPSTVDLSRIPHSMSTLG
eukprot:TRINITY_DN7581_c0_g1_i1.p1 TRINITY_DN7581_c0_g1~~TRINITY_DN7581_c0_g1_i1.p1  ORF type:complete len:1343 (+),score=397.44 TRINITY_DN7581_c0_g1_i1:64-4092(+)